MAGADTVNFDPTTAQLDTTGGGFDPSTAQLETNAVPPPARPGATGSWDDIDETSGLPFLDRVHLAQADNLEEKERYLINRYGKGNVGREWGGTEPVLWVKINGKKVAAEGGGQFLSSLTGDIPEMTGMTAGAMAGGEYGSVLGPYGTLAGGILGAGIGGMLGKGAVEGQKALTGEYAKTPTQLGHELGMSGLEGMGGETGGRMLTKGLSRLTRGPLPGWITDASDETKAMTSRVLEGGAMPPSTSTMPGARKIQRIETLASKISGPAKKQEKANRAYLENRVRQILQRSGIPDEHIEALVKELDEPTSTLTTQQIGKDLQEAVRAHIATLEQSAETNISNLNKEIDKSLAHLNKLSERYKPGDLGLDVSQGISQARQQFAAATTKAYKQVDRIAGGKPLVPTSSMRREAQRLVALLPESDASRPVVKAIADYPEMVTFEQAQRARTQLHELMDSQNLTPGATKHEYRRIADSIDRAFDQAKHMVADDFISHSEAKMAPEDEALLKEFGLAPQRLPRANAEEMAQRSRSAAKMLEAADEAYQKGIKRFQDAQVNRLVNSARAGLPPDPAVIARMIVQPGQEARVREIRKLVGEDTFKRVMAQDWQNMLGSATSKDGSETISGQALYREVMKRGKLLEAVYGDTEAARIRDVSQALSARDEKLPPDMLEPGKIRDLYSMILDSRKALNDFMKENYLSAIANPQRTPEQAYRWLTEPGQTDRLQQAVKFYGSNSPQMQAVRQQATKTLLDGVVTRAAKGEGSKALNNALKEYTEEQQKILFPNGLDEDFRLLGREIEFLFPNQADQAMAGFTAGNILEMPWYKRYYHQIVGGGWRMLVQHPAMVRALAVGLRGSGPTRDMTRQSIKEMAYFTALEAGDDEGTDEQQRPQPASQPGSPQAVGGGSSP